MSFAVEMKCPWHSITTRLWGALYDLILTLVFMKCFGMRTLAHECLVVPVACSAWRLSRQCSSRAAVSLWVFGSAVPAALAKDFCPREKILRHEKQTDPDVRSGWFERKGFTALMPKPTCRAWIRIPLPKSFVATGSSTPVPSGNGGEENCISECATCCACGELTSITLVVCKVCAT